MASDLRAGSTRGGRVRAAATLLLGLVIVSLTACTTGSASPGPTTSAPAYASASPSVTQPSSLPGVRSPSAPTPSGGGVEAATEQVIAELMAAIGNPDTGSRSEAMTAFEAALSTGDEAVIRSSSQVVLGHLANGRATITAVTAPGCAVFCPEWDQMLAGVADGIGAMRDAGISRDTVAIEAGRLRIQEALLDHFWQGIRGGDPDLYAAGLRDGRIANASRARWSTSAALAFDGSEATSWTAGDAAAPQWIEIDVGFTATLRSVRLLTVQDVAGPTEHRITVCGADGSERDVARLAGETADRQWLDYKAPAPVSDVRVVRVTTLATPSMIGWREIELGLGPGAPPSPSTDQRARTKCGLTDVTAGATATGQPSLAGGEPALAIDDDPTTGWDPGSRGSIRIHLTRMVVASEIRLLVGEPAGSTADYRFLAVLEGNRRYLIGTLSGTTSPGVWRSLTGLQPPSTFQDLEVSVQSTSQAAEVLEIQVIGTPLGGG